MVKGEDSAFLNFVKSSLSVMTMTMMRQLWTFLSTGQHKLPVGVRTGSCVQMDRRSRTEITDKDKQPCTNNLIYNYNYALIELTVLLVLFQISNSIHNSPDYSRAIRFNWI